MAWWTHLIFFGARLENQLNEQEKEEGNIFIVFGRVLKNYFYEKLTEILYFLLATITYLYLALSIVTFFFDKYVPQIFPFIISTLSEPYLGVLGVYVVVKEINKRRGKMAPKHWGELFVGLWFMFFITATLLTIFSEHYYTNAIYKTIVTNSLAALIIRIGTLLR